MVDFRIIREAYKRDWFGPPVPVSPVITKRSNASFVDFLESVKPKNIRDGDNCFFRFGELYALPSEREFKDFVSNERTKRRINGKEFVSLYTSAVADTRIKYGEPKGKSRTVESTVAMMLKFASIVFHANVDLDMRSVPKTSGDFLFLMSQETMWGYSKASYLTPLLLNSVIPEDERGVAIDSQLPAVGVLAHTLARFPRALIESFKASITLDKTSQFAMSGHVFDRRIGDVLSGTLGDSWLSWSIALSNSGKTLAEISDIAPQFALLDFDQAAPYLSGGVYDPKVISSCIENRVSPDMATRTLLSAV